MTKNMWSLDQIRTLWSKFTGETASFAKDDIMQLFKHIDTLQARLDLIEPLVSALNGGTPEEAKKALTNIRKHTDDETDS